MTNEPWALFPSQTGFELITDYFLEIFCVKCNLNELTDILEDAPRAPFGAKQFQQSFTY